jgi:hypothetical protein
MTDPLSTDDGEGKSDFESLEERIVYTERDKENEVRTSARLADYQVSVIDKINRSLGTNKVEVTTRAYNAGLSELRQIDFVDRTDDILRLNDIIVDFVQDNAEYWDEIGDDVVRYDNYSVSVDESDVELEDEPSKLTVKDSVLSEVKHRLDDIVMLKSGLHRPLIGIGLSTSEYSTVVCDRFAEQYIEYFDDVIRESRALQEKHIATGIPGLYHIFREEGIEEKHYEILQESVELMNTEYKDTMGEIVDFIGTAYDVH